MKLMLNQLKNIQPLKKKLEMNMILGGGSIEKTHYCKYPKFAKMLKNDIIGNEEGMDF
jgi:hypothetical protein